MKSKLSLFDWLVLTVLVVCTQVALGFKEPVIANAQEEPKKLDPQATADLVTKSVFEAISEKETSMGGVTNWPKHMLAKLSRDNISPGQDGSRWTFNQMRAVEGVRGLSLMGLAYIEASSSWWNWGENAEADGDRLSIVMYNACNRPPFIWARMDNP